MAGSLSASTTADVVSDIVVSDQSGITVLPVGQLTLFELADIANREHALAVESVVASLQHAWLSGSALIAAKSQLRHGEWLGWLKANFVATRRTATTYMQIANGKHASHLEEPSIRKALEAISNESSELGGLKESVHVQWYTPAPYIAAARAVMGAIDLDPATSEMANETVRADRYYTEDDDGLEHEWSGRVWLNPPYGQGSGLFTTKLVREYEAGRTTAAILLLNAYGFDSQWFQPLWNHPICFTNHRVQFTNPDRETGGPANANIFVYLGVDRQLFADTFSQFGAVVERVA